MAAFSEKQFWDLVFNAVDSLDIQTAEKMNNTVDILVVRQYNLVIRQHAFVVWQYVFSIIQLIISNFNCVMLEMPLNSNINKIYILDTDKSNYIHYLREFLKQPHEMFTFIGELQ